MFRILKGISFVLHPIVMPLIGVLFFFSKTPRYFSEQLIYAKVISLFILTVILPILLYFLLRTLGKAHSIFLRTAKERVIPLAINCLILLLILRRVVPANQIIELYYFFLGILVSTLACLILAMLKVKASLHLMAIAGIFMFFVALSIHYGINLNGSLALVVILIGAVATSRLELKAHNFKEISIGFFIGLLPQLLLINYWL